MGPRALCHFVKKWRIILGHEVEKCKAVLTLSDDRAVVCANRQMETIPRNQVPPRKRGLKERVSP
jgi:hypothetical protein